MLMPGGAAQHHQLFWQGRRGAQGVGRESAIGDLPTLLFDVYRRPACQTDRFRVCDMDER